MIWFLDLALVALVSLFLGMHFVFLGISVFFLGLFFCFQFRRTRLLVGNRIRILSTTRKITAGLAALLMTGLLAPLVVQDTIPQDSFEKSNQPDAALPLVVLIGILSAIFMIGLSVERRKR